MTAAGPARPGARPWQGDFFGDRAVSFAPPTARADRIGVIDVGSNSVRLVVFEGHCRSPTVLYNEKVMCGLGARLAETGRLDPEGRRRAAAALRRFAALGRVLRLGALAGVATAAIREAQDGPVFRREIEAETGIRLEIASGADEARLAAQGVLLGNPRAEGVVVDLGGASMEICRLSAGRPGEGLSTPLGPMRLAGLFGQGGAFEREVRGHLAPLAGRFGVAGGRLYLVGGTWRALAKANMARIGYPLQVLHEYEIPAREVRRLAKWIPAAGPEALAAVPGVSQNRVETLPLAARLLGELVRALEPGTLVVSAFGLREGICLENLPPALGAEDPLIAAAREQELRRARAPGFGAELGRWVADLLGPRDPGEARLMQAAAHLADLNWRTHPDYRAQGCWETVTRNTITDLGHEARVFLGAALVHRYGSGRKALEGVPEMALLDPGRQARAGELGLALRLGSVLGGAAPGVLAHCPVADRDGCIDLALRGPARGFAGEEVEKRLAQLARAMGRDWVIRDGAEAD